MSGKVLFDRDKRMRELKWVEYVSTLLDSKFKVGSFRFGLDPILNFFPVIGQTITFATSVLLVLVMLRNGISAKAATKMLLNTIFDALFGAIPIIGNIFDFFFKANKRNVRLLKEHYYEGKHQGGAKGILTVLMCVLLGLSLLILYFLWLFGAWAVDIIAY